MKTHSSSSPRIAIVAASPAIVGGHSVQAATLARELRREGAQVEAIAIDVRLPAWLAWVRAWRGVRTIVNEVAYLATLHRLAHVDVVHAFAASYWSFLLAPVPAMLAGRLLGKHVVLHYHSGEVADHLARWGRWVHPWLKLPHRIVVCSRFQQEAFETHGYSARVIANVVDARAFGYRPRDPLRPRFICTRNFERHYGVDVAIDAFALVRRWYPEATLVLVGSGSEEPSLRARAAAVGEGGIVFAGAVAPEDMPLHLDLADIYLNASSIDNQPVSLIEACASGVAIVSTPAGGIPEFVVQGRSGVIVDRPEAGRIAAAAVALLACPDAAAVLARGAREMVARFSWQAVRSSWEDVYGLRFTAGRSAASGAKLEALGRAEGRA